MPRTKAPTATRTCSRCGRTAVCGQDSIPLGWTVMTEGRRIQYVCVECSRANLRAIEGKLPEEYWEF